MDNYFQTLNNINVNDKAEKKGNLTYLSWPFAWGEIKKLHPDAMYTIYENANGWNYHTDGRTAWVKTGVTICGIEHIEYLPIMDNRNNSIPLERITSRNVNDAIQRSITKACARHGLGLYIYAGEDLPEIVQELPFDEKPAQAPTPPEKPVGEYTCEKCGKPLKAYVGGTGRQVTPFEHARRSKKVFGQILCMDCVKDAKGQD